MVGIPQDAGCCTRISESGVSEALFDSTKLLGLIVVIILLALPERISARAGEKLEK